jgi:hypothetical protein
MKRRAPAGVLDWPPVWCDTVIIPQGLRKFTLVEAALGRDMTV